MKIFKQVMLLTGIFTLVTLLSACDNKKDETVDQWSKIEQSKTIIVGLDDTFVPMGFRDETGELQGFDIDLAKAVFAKHAITAKFQPIEWQMKESELYNNTIDVIWNGYTVNPNRQAKVLFSTPYMENNQVIVSLKASNINSFSGMKDKRLATQLGGSGQDNMAAEPEKLTNIIQDNEAVLFDTFNEALIDLNSKRVEGILIDGSYAGYYISKQANKDDYSITSKGGFAPEYYAVGMRKSDVLLKEKIDQALLELYQDGTIQEISKKWFGVDYSVKQ